MTSASTTEIDRRGVAAPNTATHPARKGRITLLLLAAVCVLPVLASYFMFYVWQPEGRTNYGELLAPTALPDLPLAGTAGQAALPRSEMNGRWTFVYIGPGACGTRCEQALYTMRQSRLAQNEEMRRVSRLWLVTGTDEPNATVLGAHEGLRAARAEAAWLDRFPGADAQSHLYLVDPLGNVMMRFPEQADAKRVIKDLQRLLKYSALGRG